MPQQLHHHARVELDVGVAARGPGLSSASSADDPLLDRAGELDQLAAELLRRLAQHARARVVGAVDGVAEAHDPLARARPGRAPSRRSGPASPISSSASSARLGRAAVQRARTARRAPPTRRPPTSAPVEATTRAVNVEALKPWSTVAIEVRSTARACSGVGLGAGASCRASSRRCRARTRGERARAPAGAGAARPGSSASRRTGAARRPAGWPGRCPTAGAGPRGAGEGERGAQAARAAGAAGRGDQRAAAARDARRAARAARPISAANAARLGGVGQRAVDHAGPDVLEAAGAGQVDGGVLAVVVEALVARGRRRPSVAVTHHVRADRPGVTVAQCVGVLFASPPVRERQTIVNIDPVNSRDGAEDGS